MDTYIQKLVDGQKLINKYKPKNIYKMKKNLNQIFFKRTSEKPKTASIMKLWKVNNQSYCMY